MADGHWSMATWNPGTGSTLEIEAFVRDAYESQVAVVNLQEFHDRISITGDWLQLRSNLGGRHLLILGHPKRIRSIARQHEELCDDRTAWLSAVLTTHDHERVYNVCTHIDHTIANPNNRGTSTKRQAILGTFANAISEEWGAHDLHVLAGDFNRPGVANRMHQQLAARSIHAVQTLHRDDCYHKQSEPCDIIANKQLQSHALSRSPQFIRIQEHHLIVCPVPFLSSLRGD